MLNKIKLITAVLFLGASLVSAETYNEFRAKNGMDSKGKTVKSSTSANFQRTTPKNSEMAKNIKHYVQVPAFKLESDVRADEFKASWIGYGNSSIEEDVDEFYRNIEDRYSTYFKLSEKPRKLGIITVDDFNEGINKFGINYSIPLIKSLRTECLSKVKRKIRAGKRVYYAAVVTHGYRLDLMPSDGNKVLTDETYGVALCAIQYR